MVQGSGTNARVVFESGLAVYPVHSMPDRAGSNPNMKVVTVHRGARDSYQVARGLSDAGMLDTLVTDLYWPAERPWARRLERLVPASVSNALLYRYAKSLPSASVASCWTSGLCSLAVSKMRFAPYFLQRDSVRWCDRDLGRRAGELASARGAALLSYSYYGHSAFSHYTGTQPQILFQLHPHPASIRTILRAERELHPECASSLDKEWELALPEEDFKELERETRMPAHWLVASTFTKQTLTEQGIPGERVSVIPYGIDLEKFRYLKDERRPGGPLQLLFVGTIGQRKGIKYLLDALDLLPAGSVELTVCGRPVDDLALLRNQKTPIRVHPSISAQGLLDAYRAADIFVFPSLAEGFGHVLLEAMASGLPIISTTRTAATDLVRQEREGLVIEPGSASQIATAIEHFLRRPEDVSTMGRAARDRAEHFTWARFRTRIAAVVAEILGGLQIAGAHGV
jgi:glycosyltransferase involved in cell wall biosynthesis